jgi:hypothetical protein
MASSVESKPHGGLMGATLMTGWRAAVAAFRVPGVKPALRKHPAWIDPELNHASPGAAALRGYALPPELRRARAVSTATVNPMQNSSASTPLTRDAMLAALVACGTRVSGSTTKFIAAYTTAP